MKIPVKFEADDNGKLTYKINAEITDCETLESVYNYGYCSNIQFTQEEEVRLWNNQAVIKLVDMYYLGYNRMDIVWGSPHFSRKATREESDEAENVFNRLLASSNPDFYDPTYAGGKADKGHGFWIQIGYKTIKEIKEMLGMNDIQKR